MPKTLQQQIHETGQCQSDNYETKDTTCKTCHTPNP